MKEKELGRYIRVHPGAHDPRRRWPIENFAFIANQIATHGYPPRFEDSLEEKSLLGELQQQIRRPVISIVETFGHLTLFIHGRTVASA